MRIRILTLILIIFSIVGCEKKSFTHKSNKTEDDFIKESVNESMKNTEEIFNKLNQKKINREEKTAKKIIFPTQMQSENKKLLNKAMKLKKEGKFLEAIKVLKTVLIDEPKNISILENISELYTNINNFEEAKNYAEKILRIDDKNIFALTIIANLYAKNNETNKAINTYLKLIQINPTHVLLHNLGVLYEKQGKLKKAFEFYKKESRKYETARGYYALAVISKKLNNNTDTIKYLRKSLLKENSVKVKRFLATEYLNQKMFKNAISIYEDIAKKSNNIEDYNNLANAYFSTGNYSNAEEIYKKALITSPNNTNVLYNMALCYYKMKSPIKMEQIIKEYQNNNANITQIRQLKVYLSKISK